jgi:hypothetical protein
MAMITADSPMTTAEVIVASFETPAGAGSSG